MVKQSLSIYDKKKKKKKKKKADHVFANLRIASQIHVVFQQKKSRFITSQESIPSAISYSKIEFIIRFRQNSNFKTIELDIGSYIYS